MEERHFTDLLPAYALDCLDADENRLVRAHLAGCAACRAELETLQVASAHLIHAAPPSTPPETIKLQLMASLKPRSTYAWFDKLLRTWPRLIPATAVAAAVLTVVLGTSTLLMLRAKPFAAGSGIEALKVVRLQGTAEMPEARGVLLIDPAQGSGLLVVDSMKELDRSLQYQLWLIKDGRRTSGGTFSVSPGGEARLAVVPAQPLATFDAFGITIEPFGGSPGPTGGKVLGGKLVM